MGLLSRRERSSTRRYLKALDKAYVNRHNITLHWPGATPKECMLASAVLSSEKLGELIAEHMTEMEAF